MSYFMIKKISEMAVPSYYQHYFNLVKEDNLHEALLNSKATTLQMLAGISAEKENHAYAENKWTVKQVLNHIIDTERIFSYRALRFSRKDATPLQGFDENSYAQNAVLTHLPISSLIEEFEAVRTATILQFNNLSNDALDLEGEANQVVFTPRILGFIIAGHNIHHCNILQERYL